MYDGCVTAGMCPLDPIGDPVPQFPGTSYADPSLCYWGCGWNASAADYGGGDYSDPGDPIEDGVSADQYADCHTSDTGTCELYPATPAQVQHARDEIAKMRAEGICGQIKAKASEVVDNGLKMWDPQARQDGWLLAGDLAWEFVGETGIERVPVMHLWSDPRYFNAATIAHEAMHALDPAWTHSPDPETYLVGPDGVRRSFDATAHYCARS